MSCNAPNIENQSKPIKPIIGTWKLLTGVLIEKLMATAYQWHNYGKDTIGARSDVENVKIPTKAINIIFFMLYKLYF